MRLALIVPSTPSGWANVLMRSSSNIHATSRSAKKTLVNACTNNENTRETMITTLRIVQELQPRYDMGCSRAVYDVSGQGLPYERFVLERDNDMRWYIAE